MHAAAALGALAENVRTELAVVVVVLLAFVGTRLTDIGTQLTQLVAVVRIAGHEPCVQRRDVRDVTAEADALGHVFAVVGTRVGTPLAGFGGLGTDFDAVALFFAQMIDFGDGV
ncbi:hypothetical protein GCM10025751_46850 [Haladaptatus pallidirubidus]|uniref:Uncharacterized protein n=1 Tax=Haladaptatus pallidirubidus TaxID=1008152 RepID=A0AAV3UP42_9EURY